MLLYNREETHPCHDLERTSGCRRTMHENEQSPFLVFLFKKIRVREKMIILRFFFSIV